MHLLDRLLALLVSDPAFTHFTLDGQTIVLDDYLEIRPEQRESIESLVASGRLLTGPWYILPDEFLVSPEATIRNLLRGRQEAERFGGRMDVGYSPDPFGHIGQLPQILLGFGIHRAAFRRGLSVEPCELWWASPGGGRLLVAYLRDGYDNAANLPTEQDAFDTFLQQESEALASHSAAHQQLLMNGTDHQEPQPELPALIAGSKLDDELRISTLPAYFDALESEIASRALDLPTLSGELRDPRRHHLLPGVLSSRVGIKQRNHACEVLLERWAEPFSALAEWAAPPDIREAETITTGHRQLTSLKSPQALVDRAWDLLMQCHPHDSICGCSVDQVHEEMIPRFDQAAQIGEEVTRIALGTLVRQIDRSGSVSDDGGLALTAFNPHPFRVRESLKIVFEVPAGLDPFNVLDEEGRTIPCAVRGHTARDLGTFDLDRDGMMGMLAMVQDGRAMGFAVQGFAANVQGDTASVDVVVAEDVEPNLAATERGLRRVRELLADEHITKYHAHARFGSTVEAQVGPLDLPALGYRTLHLAPGSPPAQPVQDSGRVVENDRLKVELSDDGTLIIEDKNSGRTLSGLARFLDVADRGDAYNFCPLAGDEPIVPSEPETVLRTVSARGATLRYELPYALPIGLSDDRQARSEMQIARSLTVEASLADGAAWLDLHIGWDNRAGDHRLQISFASGKPTEEGIFDGHFELVHRSTQLPEADDDWVEVPVPEAPMRAWVASGLGAGDLMVAARGLREASVSPQGEIRLTLLRCFGWLSRDDLATRRGSAGPTVATPGGQSHGQHHFDLRVIPIGEDPWAAVQAAQAFQSRPRGAIQEAEAGPLPPSASFFAVEPPSFSVTAVKRAEDGGGLIIRGVNLGAAPCRTRIQSLWPVASAWLARLDETPTAQLDLPSPHEIVAQAEPGEIVTIRLSFNTKQA